MILHRNKDTMADDMDEYKPIDLIAATKAQNRSFAGSSIGQTVKFSRPMHDLYQKKRVVQNSTGIDYGGSNEAANLSYETMERAQQVESNERRLQELVSI